MNKTKLGSLVGTRVRLLSLDGCDLPNRPIAVVEEVSELGFLFREEKTKNLHYGTTCSFRTLRDR